MATKRNAPVDSGQRELPIQPVDKPILCSPYVEPDLHWVYDQTTGIPTRTPGRRPASYWYKTERTGHAQQQLAFMAEEDRDDLPLVNALREDVRRWHQAGWAGASETTKKLLRHWCREDRPRRLFFCQLEAVETIIYLREMLAQEYPGEAWRIQEDPRLERGGCRVETGATEIDANMEDRWQRIVSALGSDVPWRK